MSAQSAFIALLDVLLVAYLIYRLLMLVRGTRAWRILGGIVIFVLITFLSDKLGFSTLHWLLDKATPLGPVALVILLLPELRQAIEGVGKLGLWPQKLTVGAEDVAAAGTVEELVAAMAELSTQHVGALVVIERAAPLDEIVANGVLLNAKVSAALLGSIFYDNNPLHDGAVIMKGDLIVAAASRLPLSESALDAKVHMRHRAAVGVTEALDCIAIVVSEERGTISIAQDGHLRKLGSPMELRDFLNKELRGGIPKDTKPKRALRRKPEVKAK